MKKFRFQFLAAVALLVLAACSSTDESVNDQTIAEPQPVGFDVYVNQNTTRGGYSSGEISTTTLQSEGFGVFAYYTDNVEYSGTTIPNFMYNQKVSTSSWTYSPIKYWPNEYGSNAASDDIDKVSFFAYGPYVDVTPSTGQLSGAGEDKNSGIIQLSRNTASGDPIVKYAINGNGAGVDLVWGVESTSGKPHLDLTRTSGTVNFTFKHALAKLSANVKTDIAVDAKTKVYVRSVTITGFASKGALNLNNIVQNVPLWTNTDGSDLTSEGATFNDGRKDGREGTSEGEQSNEKNILLNPTVIQMNIATNGVTNTIVPLFSNALNTIYIIPAGSTEPVDVTIVYDVETEDDNLSTYLSDGTKHGSSVENRITKTKVFGTSTGFEAGKAYTLNLILGLKKVEVSASVDSWDSTGGPVSPTLP